MMTRYDPHPQDYDDARTGPQASREAAGRDETASRVSGDGQGLRGALEALADELDRRADEVRIMADQYGGYYTGVRTASMDASDRLRAVLSAHPADAEAPEPREDVVEQVAQVLYDVHGAEPRIKAHALADAGLLVDPEVSERAERDRAIVEQRPLVDSLIEAWRQRDKAEKSLHRVRRALDDEEANLADDGARLSHAVVRRLRAALSDTGQTSDATPSDTTTEED